MQRSTIGVGSALRKARLARGMSIEEAARDTRIRLDFLGALEEEDFDRLLGDVHVRGCLRSYASYLGLSPDTVVGVYSKHAAEPIPATPVLEPPPTEAVVGAPRRLDSHRLMVMVAATLLILAAAFGVLSTRGPAPPPAEPAEEGVTAAGAALDAPGVVAVVKAREAVELTVTVDDGAPETFALEKGESRSFQAVVALVLRLDHGASARVTVNDVDLGIPGKAQRPWERTFGPGATPSPSG